VPEVLTSTPATPFKLGVVVNKANHNEPGNAGNATPFNK
jgi:hypothetical protein